VYRGCLQTALVKVSTDRLNLAVKGWPKTLNKMALYFFGQLEAQKLRNFTKK